MLLVDTSQTHPLCVLVSLDQILAQRIPYMCVECVEYLSECKCFFTYPLYSYFLHIKLVKSTLKCSTAISRVKRSKETSVSGIISVPFIRDLM
jgi:hypothetical protein